MFHFFLSKFKLVFLENLHSLLVSGVSTSPYQMIIIFAFVNIPLPVDLDWHILSLNTYWDQDHDEESLSMLTVAQQLGHTP